MERALEVEGLLEGARGTESPNRSATGRSVVVAAIGVAVALVVIGTVTFLRGGVSCSTAPWQSSCIAASEVVSLAEAGPTYTIMVDCGSSGTRLKVFKKKGEKVKEVELKEKIEMDALTEYVDRLGDLDGDLKQMIKASKKYVPKARRGQTHLFMYATAGMRVLPAEDQSAVFSECREKLSDSTFSPYLFDDARTLSGEMEAAFQYLSVNYVKSKSYDFPEKTVGQIEMGGASLQVAFDPKDVVLDNSWVYELDGNRHTIYAKSYMGYGQNLARLKTQEAAVRAAQSRRLSSTRRLLGNRSGAVAGSVPYPCFLTGYKETVKVFEGTPEEQDATLVGSSDAQGCAELTKEILHTDYDCDLPPCAIRGEYMTKATGRFIGISGFKFALLNLGLNPDSTTPGDLLAGVQKFCGRSFADLGSNTKFTKYECFLGNFAYSMLHALGFADDSTAVSFAGDYSWTLGAVMYEAAGSHKTTRRRLLELPGVESVPPMDHRCYWACRSRQRCAGLAAGPGRQCKRACTASCAA